MDSVTRGLAHRETVAAPENRRHVEHQIDTEDGKGGTHGGREGRMGVPAMTPDVRGTP